MTMFSVKIIKLCALQCSTFCSQGCYLHALKVASPGSVLLTQGQCVLRKGKDLFLLLQPRSDAKESPPWLPQQLPRPQKGRWDQGELAKGLGSRAQKLRRASGLAVAPHGSPKALVPVCCNWFCFIFFTFKDSKIFEMSIIFKVFWCILSFQGF